MGCSRMGWVRGRTEVAEALDLIAAVVEHAGLHPRLLPRHGREPLAAIALAPLVAWVVIVWREGQAVALSRGFQSKSSLKKCRFP